MCCNIIYWFFAAHHVLISDWHNKMYEDMCTAPSVCSTEFLAVIYAWIIPEWFQTG